ncbi:MAG: YwaF family protein [Propionibacteriaceae bacterium]|nr:YwaF family protein [Propionibacteriaceae bacterium]
MNDRWYDYFWTNPGAGTPPGLAFGLFTTAHLVFLAVMAILATVIVLVYRAESGARRRAMRLTLGITVFALEALREAGYFFSGHYTAAILPLHLCAIASLCVFVDSIRPNSWCRAYLYALGAWGPVCAMVFADWSTQPWFNIYTWQGFLIHGCMWAYILAILVSGEYRPSLRDLWKAVVIMVAAIGLSLLVNHYWNTNFWFLNTGSPGSPLEPIQKLAGPWYIPVLILLLGLIWTVLYLPWSRRKAGPTAPALPAPQHGAQTPDASGPPGEDNDSPSDRRSSPPPTRPGSETASTWPESR